jgi:hypothetical protein
LVSAFKYHPFDEGALVLLGWQNVGFKMSLHSVRGRLERRMDNSIIFQKGRNRPRFPRRLGQRIVEGKEVKTVVGDQDTEDNALKASTVLFPLTFRDAFFLSWFENHPVILILKKDKIRENLFTT